MNSIYKRHQKINLPKSPYNLSLLDDPSNLLMNINSSVANKTDRGNNKEKKVKTREPGHCSQKASPEPSPVILENAKIHYDG